MKPVQISCLLFIIFTSLLANCSSFAELHAKADPSSKTQASRQEKPEKAKSPQADKQASQAKKESEAAKPGIGKSASTAKEDKDDKDAKVEQKKAAQSITGKGSVKTAAPKKNSSQLVPPPPPVVPTLSGAELGSIPGSYLFVGEGIEFMPLSELKELRGRNELELEKLKSQLEELKQTVKDKQQRAETFDALYAQGVVSRRELENCRKESEQSANELEEKQQLVELALAKQKRIEKRLADIAKENSRPKSARKKIPQKK